jgi:hypothetical protein
MEADFEGPRAARAPCHGRSGRRSRGSTITWASPSPTLSKKYRTLSGRSSFCSQIRASSSLSTESLAGSAMATGRGPRWAPSRAAGLSAPAWARPRPPRPPVRKGGACGRTWDLLLASGGRYLRFHAITSSRTSLSVGVTARPTLVPSQRSERSEQSPAASYWAAARTSPRSDQSPRAIDPSRTRKS